MDYSLAIVAGRIAMGLVFFATLYYVLRTILVNLISRKTANRTVRFVRLAVAYARQAHPFIGLILPVFAGYHILVVVLSKPDGAKPLSGLATALALTFMIASSIWLKSRLSDARLRARHRAGMYCVVSLVLLHRFL